METGVVRGYLKNMVADSPLSDDLSEKMTAPNHREAWIEKKCVESDCQGKLDSGDFWQASNTTLPEKFRTDGTQSPFTTKGDAALVDHCVLV